MTRRDEADRILATRLMRERLLAGKSREELGRALGISAQIIRAYEFGAERLPAKFITAAVRALGVPLRMLCFDEDQRRVGDTGQDPDAPTRLALLRPLPASLRSHRS